MEKMVHLKESLIIPKGVPKDLREKKENLIFCTHSDEFTLSGSSEREWWLDEPWGEREGAQTWNPMGFSGRRDQ